MPAFLLLWLFYRWDQNPKPPQIIWKVFGLGMLATAVAIPASFFIKSHLIDSGFLPGPWAEGFAEALLCAAAPEEILKFIVLLDLALRQQAFKEPMDGVVFGAAASLGFAAQENLLYTMFGGVSVAALRSLTAVPAHALYGAMMGYFLGRARFRKGESGVRGYLSALLYPITFHTLYNFPLAVSTRLATSSWAASWFPLLAAVFVLAVGWVWLVIRVRQVAAEQRALEAPCFFFSALGTAGVAGRVRKTRHPTGRLILGGLLATGGAAVFIGMGIGLLLAPEQSQEVGRLWRTTIVFGAVPMAVGLFIYWRGICCLPPGDEASGVGTTGESDD